MRYGGDDDGVEFVVSGKMQKKKRYLRKEKVKAPYSDTSGATPVSVGLCVEFCICVNSYTHTIIRYERDHSITHIRMYLQSLII